MRTTLKALSALLGYPDAALQAAVPEIRRALRDERALPADALRALEGLLDHVADTELMELQAAYVETFDGSRARSLHLFEHVHGESRERGQALIDLGGQYLERGFMIEGGELADYLPLFLEFAAHLPPAEAKDWLGQPAHVFAALHERLAERGSPWAGALGALLALPRARPDPEAVDALRRRMAAEEARPIDEAWAEESVTFTAPRPVTAVISTVALKVRSALGRKGA
jgi:nitrate reductase delta subunit